ncbi:aminotransferase class V-fold PLP-dependent enzyme [Jonesia denitrificans]|uniref:Cysteine desulfurase n=1 Tax=Jonesia denitrificans (strain ATCC 14870 / DSM 20603 / BCRC 15368 / CIP 55.134 / JCM 11481 / NBRC 15587 / NCTC 10816 / Prevot 55134) TaxID=471856 RepID=C7R4P7_JONDD|nr:aminotransferase class V-fold PLP-dependent enzyme [Jonesia denitrificans]ACV09104.1 Cysteine desulfurase [Jonesia denitrificans DSM 20603]ASE09611.1 aminotransferase class V-fold PLP-dependent enzyme [Jonesia denitrificans]SQH21290.1 Cysteine desulfurase [Jonesia denitrificans]
MASQPRTPDASGASESTSPPFTPTRTHMDAGGNQRITELGRTAYLQALDDGWADPRRLNSESRRAAALLDAAREAIASVLGFHPSEVHIGPSLVEVAHRTVGAVLRGRRRVGTGLVMSAVERAALINAATFHGATPTLVGVDSHGRVDADAFVSELGSDGIAAAVLQAANHEVGTTQPVDIVAQAAKAHGIPLIVDAGASIGHIAPPAYGDVVLAQPADWGGGHGVGIAGVRARTRIARNWPEDTEPWFPGTVNIPAVFAAAVTLGEAERERQEWAARSAGFVDEIRAAASLVPDCEVVGDPVNRLPHVVTFSCLYVDGEALVTEWDRRGFAVGSGSACTSLTLQPSHVLAAMGVLTHGNVRLVVDKSVTADDVHRLCHQIPDVVAQVRSQLGVDGL